MSNEIERLREHLRIMALDQPTTGDRETYSDGFAQGLFYAVRRIDALAASKEAEPVVWRDITTAPRDGTMLRLLIRPGTGEDDGWTSFEDIAETYETIGFNSLSNTSEDEWQFAGWDWCHDCFTDGAGDVIGWLPFDASPPDQSQEIERLRARVAELERERDCATSSMREAHEMLDRVRQADELAAQRPVDWPNCASAETYHERIRRLEAGEYHWKARAEAAETRLASQERAPVVKPLDLSNLLRHAFASGFEIAGGNCTDEWWPAYDPEECPAYARVLAALQKRGAVVTGSQIEAAREFVKRHPALSQIDLAEFEAFLKVPAALAPSRGEGE